MPSAPLTHNQVWTALDRLAARAKLSPSGLAKRSGLDPTTFNKSKRITPDGRARWPSTESVAKALAATGVSVESFVSLISDSSPATQAVPLIGFAEAGSGGFFDDGGFPVGKGWDEIAFPEQARALTAFSPSALAAFGRLRQGLEPVTPDPALDLAAGFLHQLSGTAPDPAAARAERLLDEPARAVDVGPVDLGSRPDLGRRNRLGGALRDDAVVGRHCVQATNVRPPSERPNHSEKLERRLPSVAFSSLRSVVRFSGPPAAPSALAAWSNIWPEFA